METVSEIALKIIEKESGRLRKELQQGKKLSFKDVKTILAGLGLLANDKQIQEEAGKKAWWYPAALAGFAEFTRHL